MKRKLRIRALVALTSLALVLITTLVAIPGPVYAASGGGCGPWDYDSSGYAKACISAPGYGVGRPDGYVTLYSGHPSCTIYVRAYRLSDGYRMSSRQYTCPSGAVSGAHVYGYDFYARDYHYYYTEVRVSNTLLSPVSPSLKLP